MVGISPEVAAILADPEKFLPKVEAVSPPPVTFVTRAVALELTKKVYPFHVRCPMIGCGFDWDTISADERQALENARQVHEHMQEGERVRCSGRHLVAERLGEIEVPVDFETYGRGVIIEIGPEDLMGPLPKD